jgi:hypothetical protein
VLRSPSGGQVSALPRLLDAQPGRSRASKMFAPGSAAVLGKDLWASGASAARGRVARFGAVAQADRPEWVLRSKPRAHADAKHLRKVTCYSRSAATGRCSSQFSARHQIQTRSA